LIPSDGDKLYYTVPDHGGIVVFPLDGSPPQWISPANTPGMPTAVIDHALFVGRRLFALTGNKDYCTQTSLVRVGSSTRHDDSPLLEREKRCYVHWHDPDQGGWRVIASSCRAVKTTPLDEPQTYRPGAVYDAPRQRILFVAGERSKKGLYQFNTKTLALKRLKMFRHSKPAWCKRVSEHRLWFAFVPHAKEFAVSNLVEFDLQTDRWREIVRWKGARPAKHYVGDLAPSKRVIYANRKVYPPFVEVDGWIWSFHPLSRFSPDGRAYQQFNDLLVKPLEDSLKSKIGAGYSLVAPDANTLQYLPKRRALLYGNHNGLWYLELPASRSCQPATTSN
jgi:hypothetical protein